MTLLQNLNTGVGHLKAGFLGFPKSGKTWTATSLAIGTRKFFGLDGPIAMFDTESGAAYVANRVKEEAGCDLVGVKSRALDDLMALTRECVNTNVSVLIVDSITHVWRELTDTFLRRLNEDRKQRGWREVDRLEFHHWNKLKPIWYRWTDLYLNAPLHIIICGRAGYEYEMPVNEETGKRELVKVGTKMKTETEFGFEPSLLVEMERVPVRESLRTEKFIHRATVLGDRFGVLDAAVHDNPGFDFFLPHVERLTPGAANVVDTDRASQIDVDADGNEAWRREKQAREILTEEIKGDFQKAWPGQTKEEKQARMEAMETCFGTKSWTRIEKQMDSEELRRGREALMQYIAESQTTGETNDG